MRRMIWEPNRLTARPVPDHPGIMPKPVSGRLNLMCSSAMRKSAVAASSKPPPITEPFKAAIKGTRSLVSASNARWPTRTHCRPKLSASSALHAAMSPPAQKALSPAPVMMAALIVLSASMCRAAFSSAAIIGRSSAFNFSGRAKVMTATVPFCER